MNHSQLLEAEIRFKDSRADEVKEMSQLVLDGVIQLKSLNELLRVDTRLPIETKNAAAPLLSRFINDIRCIELLASQGYSAEAETVAASAIEALSLVMEVSVDIGVAEAWISYPSPDQKEENDQKIQSGKVPLRPFQGRVNRMDSFWESIYRSTSSDVLQGEITDLSRQAIEYVKSYYALACDFKHLDPETQRDLNVVQDNPKTYGAEPDFSAYGQMICFRALRTAADLLDISFGVYGMVLGPQAAKNLIGGHIAGRQEKLEQLTKVAAENYAK